MQAQMDAVRVAVEGVVGEFDGKVMRPLQARRERPPRMFLICSALLPTRTRMRASACGSRRCALLRCSARCAGTGGSAWRQVCEDGSQRRRL
jgi:hypothetical protein